MIPYLEARLQVSKIEEQKKAKMLEGPKEQMTDQTYKDWYEQTAKDLKADRIKLEFLPPMLTDWLIQRKEINNVADYHLTAAKRIGAKLAAGTDKDTMRDYAEYKAMYQAGAFDG